jgi:undecaprenyl-diphosphatase
VDETTRARLGAAARVLLAWAIILAVVLAVGWLITHTLAPRVEPWDDDTARWFADQRTPDLGAAADVGTFLGDTPVAMAVAALVAAGFSLWRRSVRPAAYFALVVAGIGGFYWVTTALITRQRPPVRILDPGLVPDHSYPSGHVATAIAVYGGTALLCWWLAPRTRPWVWLVALLPVLVALSRLYQGAHHVTDVLTSLAYATAWLAVVATVLGLRRWEATKPDHGTGGDRDGDRAEHRHPSRAT